MNKETCLSVGADNGMTSTHLVKYSLVVMMNLCPLEELGWILPTKSKAHCWNGQYVVEGISSQLGA